MNKQSTELSLPQRAAIALNGSKHEEQFKELVTKSASITEIKNADGRAECHRALMTLKTARTAIASTGKKAREDAAAFQKAVIAEEKRLVEIIQPEEQRLQKLRDDWDAEIEAEKQRKIQAERERVAAITSRIDDIRNTPLKMAGKTPVEIQTAIDALSSKMFSANDFAEFAETAEQAIEQSSAALQTMLNAALAQEAEAERIKAEHEKLERLRAEQEAAEEQARKEREAAQAQAEAELKAQREEFERQQAEAQAEREREQARLAEEARKLEAEKAAHAARQAEEERKRKAAEQAKIDAETPEPVVEPATTTTVASAPVQKRPTDEQIISTLALHYRTHESNVIAWLLDMDLNAASKNMAEEFAA